MVYKFRQFFNLPSAKQALYRFPWYIGCICVGYLIIGDFKSWPLTRSQWPEDFYEGYVAASCLFYASLLCTTFYAYKGTSRSYIPFAILPFVSFNIWQWEMIPGFPFPALAVISIICFGIIFFGKEAKRDLPGLVLMMFFILMLSFYSYCFMDKVKEFVLWPFGTIAHFRKTF